MKIYFESLGCDKNTVDTQMMLGALMERGHSIAEEPWEGDVAVVNTCAFIKDAKQESINAILRLCEYKKEGRLGHIIVAGCLAQRYKEMITEEMPEVDLLIGTQGFGQIGEMVDGLDRGESKNYFPDINEPAVSGMKRVLTGPTHYAHLKIAEGCNKCCTYCAIPSFRGRYRSVPMETLISEAAGLAERGVRELILVAQETTLYGVDIYGSKALPRLLEKLSQIDGISRIRLLYCYPEEITDELIDSIKRLPKVCHYIDMPVQSGSDNILKAMGRAARVQGLKDIIRKLRREIPDITLRTTLITGFPGETGEDFRSTLDFVREMEFDRLGVFTYSPEENTPAASMRGQLPEFIKNKRRNRIMSIQQDITFRKMAGKVGSSVELMIDGYLPGDDVYVARAYSDAPDIDGMVFLKAPPSDMGMKYNSGDMVMAVITAAKGYDLIAEVV